ncbi:MAG: hypothetical protein NTW73_02930 [Candidatus Parcubacteria bacterium]|nr:hypothetical protein [Candidatus Parcubacteria bacterium]
MYQYCDKLAPAGRYPCLYLAKGGEVKKFKGENISDFCCIATEQYSKNGKWSSTTYQLELSPGVRPLYFLSPMHGTWGDDLKSWGEVVEKLSLPVDVAKAIIGTEFKTTANRLDKLEEFALATETEEVTTETVIISFGSPSNRAIREGYWEEPKSSQTSNGQTVTVAPGVDADWGNPSVVEPEGAKVISSRHVPGMHGGYWTVEVIVPILAA